jgi:PDDEXK-like domain of unknown function (DUF3799)
VILAPGVYPAMPFDEYFSCENISKHQLDSLARSPAHYRAALEQPRKQTAAMAFGAAVHAAVLEPGKFTERYTQAPETDKRSKLGKEAHEAAAAGGRALLKIEELVAINEMVNAINSHPFASILLAPEDGEAEVSIAWVDEETGVPCRARPDFLNAAHGVCMDLKTCQDASLGVFARSCANYTYHIQAAFYLSGLAAVKQPHDKFIFVAVETEPPYAVACYELDAEDLRIGRVRYRHALAVYQQCLASDTWPSYPEEIRVLELPAWAKFVPIA